MQNKNDLRLSMTKQRKQLSPLEQQRRSAIINSRLQNLPLFINSQRIAFYVATNQEVDVRPLMEHALKLGKECYLPVLHPTQHKRLWFVRYQAGDPLVANRYCILEPVVSDQPRVKLRTLDLVITPLLAFDSQFNRLGMGGGYYDRTFAYLRHLPHLKPKLVGVAYDFQLVAQLSADEWDVPLEMVITDLVAS